MRKDRLETLENAGLSENEAKIYLLLLEEGQMKANGIAVKTGLQRRSVYDTLHRLEGKGMVGKAKVSGVMTFSASPPSSLLTFLDEKRSAIENILPALAKKFEAGEETQVSVFYGAAGIKTVLEDILELVPEFYYSYHGQMQFYNYMPRFIQMFHDKCAEKRIWAKYLLLDVPIARKRSKLMPESKVKFIDAKTLSAGVWWTYADRLVLFVLPPEKEPVTIYIKNGELAKAFQGSFENMFKSTKSKRKAGKGK